MTKANTENITLLGKRIRSRLLAIEKSQRWLAEEIGISDESVSKWCRGDGSPKLSNLYTMARALRCSVGYLAGDEHDESIAEASRYMQEIAPNFRPQVLAGVIAVCATLPKARAEKAA